MFQLYYLKNKYHVNCICRLSGIEDYDSRGSRTATGEDIGSVIPPLMLPQFRRHSTDTSTFLIPHTQLTTCDKTRSSDNITMVSLFSNFNS